MLDFILWYAGIMAIFLVSGIVFFYQEEAKVHKADDAQAFLLVMALWVLGSIFWPIGIVVMICFFIYITIIEKLIRLVRLALGKSGG